MGKITYCIPSKNNLRYLKSSIKSIKENSSQEFDIIVYVDSDNDGTKKWLDTEGVRYLINETNIPRGIAYGYNRCIEAATTPIICMFHADMYMGKGFDTAILKYLKPLSVVSGTRIEPPLHPKGLEKIVEDFGMYPEDFKQEEFDLFVQKTIQENKDKTTRGIFAPWAIYKEDITSIGMHDETFHSYHEDSDIFNRFILNGYELIQTWEAYVYHLTCRGGQFQDGIEQVTQDEAFHNMKHKAFQHYINKWGSWIKNDEYQHPVLFPVYKKKLIINNNNPEIENILKFWFNGGSDIIVEVDGNTFTQQDLNYIVQLNEIIKDSGKIGEFELGNLKITINSLQEYQNDLIHIYKHGS
jgi:GT2 family glycosyltransferase